jgi:hypothetical protein
VLVLLVSLVVRTLTALVWGVSSASDSSTFIQAAGEWRDAGYALSWLFSEYEGRSPLYVAFLALVSRFGPDDPAAPVVAQAMISASVPFILYLGVRLGGGTTRAAWITWALALVSYELSRWNSYVLTDALLIDLSAVALVALILSLNSPNPAWGGLAGLAIALALFLRGTALPLVMAALLTCALWRPPARRTLITVLAALAAYFAYFAFSPVPLAARGTPLDGMCTYLVSGRVLWGMDEHRVTPIPQLMNDKALAPRQCIQQALTRFPLQVAGIAAYKAIVYWMPFYAHYSQRHRLVNVVLLGGPFVLAAVAVLSAPWQVRSDPLMLVPLMWVASFTILHAMTWVEGDQRFLAPVLPAVYILAGAGAARLSNLSRGRA